MKKIMKKIPKKLWRSLRNILHKSWKIRWWSASRKDIWSGSIFKDY